MPERRNRRPMMILEGTPMPGLVALGADALRVINSHPLDQVCTLSVTGTFNVSMMLEDIADGTLVPDTARMPIGPELVHHLTLRDINRDYVRTMPLTKLRRPALFILTPPPPPTMNCVAELIDGAHRLCKLVSMGYRAFDAQFVHLAAAEPYRVVHQIRKAGEWVPLADADILKTTWGQYTKPPEGKP
jgi:hypothetical protein